MFKYIKRGKNMVEKIIAWLKGHKAQIVTIITGLISLLVAINTEISTSAKTGLFITFITVALSLLLTVIQKGFTDEAINLIVKAIQIIQELMADTISTKEDNTEVVSSKKIVKLTEEEIRERLIAKD